MTCSALPDSNLKGDGCRRNRIYEREWALTKGEQRFDMEWQTLNGGARRATYRNDILEIETEGHQQRLKAKQNAAEAKKKSGAEKKLKGF